MAIYRSDQAVVTFGAEAALGGYPESATSNTTGVGAGALTANTAAGTFAISVDDASGGVAHANFAAGALITIGSATTNIELRKVVGRASTGLTLYLDAPTSAYHPNNAVIQVVSAVADVDQDKYMTFIPGVYDTVTVPDMTPTIEPRYFLGTGSKRNFSAAYKGTQAYNGSWPSFIALNAAALRFPIGRMMETAATTTTNLAAALALNGASKKGDQYITWDGSAAATFTTSVYASIGTQITDPGGSEPREIIKIVSGSGTAGASRLAYPLKYDHANDAPIQIVSGPFTHTILETNQLDSIAMNVHMKDSDETAANDFDRRFFGGKVGAATLAAEEGGLMVMGWDTIPFMGGLHNQKLDPNSSITGGDVPFYGLTQSIASDNVGSKTTVASTAISYPTTDPYYFSQGTVSLFGTEFARVRNFTININNNVEPRYYIERRGDSRLRGPSDIVEMRREYTMDATIALPDTVNSATSDTTSLFKQLMLEGDYGAGMKGFNIQLVFTRGTNDTITIDVPDDGAAAVGLDQQGAYLTEAPHPIDGSNPYEVSASMMFRNLKITVVDSEPMYP